METIDLLKGVLTKTLNMTEEELTALLFEPAGDDSKELVLKDDALNLVLDRDTSRVDNIKKSTKPDKKALQAEYDKGAFKAIEKLEKSVKELYDVESDSQGLDLVKEVVNAVSESKAQITEDDIKKHPLYRDLEKNRVPKNDLEKVQTEFDQFKSNMERNTRLGRVKSDALVIRNSLKPIISQNADVAQTRQDDFLRKFDDYDFELDDEGNHLVMKDGSRVEDGHGNPVKFQDFAANIARKCYDFQASDSAGNAGNRNNGQGGSQHIQVPKSKDEYLVQMNDLMKKGDREGRIKLKQAWDAAQKS